MHASQRVRRMGVRDMDIRCIVCGDIACHDRVCMRVKRSMGIVGDTINGYRAQRLRTIVRKVRWESEFPGEPLWAHCPECGKDKVCCYGDVCVECNLEERLREDTQSFLHLVRHGHPGTLSSMRPMYSR